MALPQEISPVNSELMDGLAAAAKMEWIVTEPGAAMKILWTGAESGRWAVLLKWDKGYVAGQHKHLSAAFVYMLKGKLQVRDGIINAGEHDGMVR